MEKTVSINWNLDSVYDGGSQSSKLRETMEQISEKIKVLSSKINNFDVGQESLESTELVKTLDGIQEVMKGALEVDDFIICTYAENVEDTEAPKLMAKSAKLTADLESLQLEMDQLLANLPEQEWKILLEKEKMEPVRFYLQERRRAVQDRLPLEVEKVINALSVNGFAGWDQHHDQLMADLDITVEEEKEPLSIGQALSQAMFSNDRQTRKQTAAAIEQVCEKNAASFASVLNHIAGFRLDLYRQRGWDDLLKETLETNRIEKETLQTMLSVIKKNKGLTREFSRRKAKVEKLEKTAWYDMQAPSFQTDKKVSYKEARDIIVRQFARFSEELGEFAHQAFFNGWIEAEDRTKKAEGGFCASFPLANESRIFLTFRGSYQDVVTIAHELGHAYHNSVLQPEPAFASQVGISVAETASTFMENFVLDAAIDEAETTQEKLSLLEMKISNGLKYLGMIPNMFEFELEFYEKRKQGLVSAAELAELMEKAESDLYGETMDEFQPNRWMVISHFYNTKKPFYNIPYTIGYLFSNGIYTLAKERGNDFAPQYKNLLRHSGRMTVEQLGDEFLDENLRESSFWEASVRPVADAVKEYLALTDDMV